MVDYRDYLWVEGHSWLNSDGYCLALVEGTTSLAALAALRASDDKLVRRGARKAFRDAYDLGEAHGVDGVDTQLVAAADLGGGWAMLLQAPGYIVISPVPLTPLVAEHDVVGHGSDRFVWWTQGQQRISFEPLLPVSDLTGVLADRQPADGRAEIISMIGEVGGIDLNETPGREFHHVAGSFALAERITGVTVDEAFLTDAEFVIAAVAYSPSPAG